MKIRRKIGKGAVIASAAGLLMAAGGAIAFAATGHDSTASRTSASSSPTTSSALPSLDSSQRGSTQSQQGQGQGQGKGQGQGGRGQGGFGGRSGTEVTGDELTKIKDAITAKDSTVTVMRVFKEEDGSFDAFGTKDGGMVRIEISSDLKTIEISEMGAGRGGQMPPGGMGGGPGMGMPGQNGGQGGGSGQSDGGQSGGLPVPTPSASSDTSTT